MTFRVGARTFSCAAIALAAVLASPASAQVSYRQRSAPYVYQLLPYSDATPYDQEFGTRPSFEIRPNPYGYAPAVRVIQRCLYPDGWNVTDFSRDVNGIPPGVNHTCPEIHYGARVRARY